MDRFWQPLEATKHKPNLTPPTVGKRPRPGNVAGDPTDWVKTTQPLPNAKQRPSWQGRKHADAPMETSKGKPKKRLMSPSACVNFHPFTEML
jgi:hypothetical protein